MGHDSKAIITAALRAAPLFNSLDSLELTSLSSRATLRRYSAGEMLFSEGEPCSGLFLVLSGRIRIFKISHSGREQVLAIEGSGASIAELPVFDGGAYPASAMAVEPSGLVFVSRDDFRTVCLENPDLSLKVLQVVGSRLRRLVGIIEELSFTTLRHRLISWLLKEAKSHGQSSGQGVSFTLTVSHHELAAQIGTVRELVSRNMARLQAQNLIAMNGHELTIVDEAALEAELSSEM
jgi:CRP/FNR family transcriptional regulator, cyclic AMP receptor protein